MNIKIGTNLIPIIMVVSIFTKLGMDDFKELNNLEKLGQNIKQAIKINELVHNLQVERGSAFNYKKSKKDKFLKISNNAVESSNKAFKDLKGITKIDKLHLQILNCRKTHKDIFSTYSNVIESLINEIYITKQSSFSIKYNLILEDLLLITRIKEYTGQERAQISNILNNGKMSKKELIMIVKLINAQDTLMAFKVKNKYTLNIAKSQETIKINKYRENILNSDLSLNSIVFFEDISNKIKILRTAENDITDNLLTAIETQEHNKISIIQMRIILGLIFLTIILLSTIISITSNRKEIK